MPTLNWMTTEAMKSSHDMNGGIILDEMSVQEDISIEFRGELIKIIGLVNISDPSGFFMTRPPSSVVAITFSGVLPLWLVCSDSPRDFFKAAKAPSAVSPSTS